MCWLYWDAEDILSWVRFSRMPSFPGGGLLRSKVLYCLDDSNTTGDGSLEESGVALYVSIATFRSDPVSRHLVKILLTVL